MVKPVELDPVLQHQGNPLCGAQSNTMTNSILIEEGQRLPHAFGVEVDWGSFTCKPTFLFVEEIILEEWKGNEKKVIHTCPASEIDQRFQRVYVGRLSL